MNKELDKENCKNCTHYMPHYIKSDSRFFKIDGHCLNRKPSGHLRKLDKVCEYFEEKDLKEEINKDIKSATEWLSVIAERLNGLVQIFTLLAEEEKHF